MRSCALHVLTAAFLASLVILAPAYSADGTIAGTITSLEPGSPAISGAVVRTDGEPGYSTTTASNGSYTLSAPAGSYVALISASGHIPQRIPVTVASGSSASLSTGLTLAPSGTAINLPAPLDSGEPPGAPTPPGDDYSVAFTDMSAIPGPSAPKIAEWNRTIKPNESFCMTGAGFTARTGADAGTDTIVWIWARTASGAGALKQAKVWKVAENTLTALMPDDIPFGVCLLWVENANGVSAPICINRPSDRWVGPLGNGVAAGAKRRVFGINISYGHGTTASYVYIQPASGGAFISCPVSRVEPYMVEFTVPAGTPNGNYRVYVHSGHGGRYGWGDPLDLVVRDEWVRGSAETSLSPNGTDDTTAIQNAINSMSALPNGGTVRLAAGTFKTYDQIWLTDKVRLVGAGMDQTTIALRLNYWRHDYFRVHGSNIAIESLTLKGCLDTPVVSGYGIIEEPYPEYNWWEATDIKYINMRITGDFGTLLLQNALGAYRVETSGCEFYRMMDTGSVDGWMHDCNLYGGPYGIYSPTYRGETEAAFGIGTHSVFEYNHIETKDWPVNPANGSLNYMDWVTDWDNQIGYKIWAKRVALGANVKIHDSYLAHFTTKDVAVQDNRGEMILYHPMGGQWWGNVLSADGLTLTLRTDGLVDGQTMSSGNYDGSLLGGQPVPDANPYWMPLDSSMATVIAGRGLGQSRTIVSHTSTTITVDSPWRIRPDSTSKIIIAPMYTNHVVYSGELNAFPAGYDQKEWNASRGVCFGGNCIECMAEGNISRRTNIARDMTADGAFSGNWNVMRNEQAIDCHNYGYQIYGRSNPVGPVLIGNAYHDCSVNIYDSAIGGGVYGLGEGTVIENSAITAKMGNQLTGVAQPGGWSDGFVLYRNGSITAIDVGTLPSVVEPVYISAIHSNQLLIGNTYSGGLQNYYLGAGLSDYSIPIAMNRAVKFQGYVGYPAASQMIPVANAGIASMTWTVTPSDPWIAASIQANSTLSAESTLGRLVIAVDTTGMTAGRRWGYVDINTGASSVRVGVCVDLLSGTPAAQSPVASFSTTPSAGISPLSVAFNASASYDPDGSIASYVWDYGDGSYGTGVTSSHAYAKSNTYTAVLTVTDNTGTSSSVWSNVLSAPPISSVTASGNPTPLTDVNVPVTLTAASVGGYQVQYRFLYKDNAGWHILRDYASGNTCVWTPTAAGYYEVKVQAKSSVSTAYYDLESSILSYPVGLIPTGMGLWLKADAGVSITGGLVSSWADQSGSGNNVSQTSAAARPSLAGNILNGRPVVRFAGPGQVLQATGQVLSGNAGFTTFTVAKLNSIPASTYQYLWWTGADSINGGYGAYLYITGAFKASWGSGSGGVADSSAETIGTWYRVDSRFNSSGNQHDLWVNNTLIGTRGKSGSSISGGAFSVGNFGPSTGYGLYGDIAEIIIYPRTLSDTERAGVDSYLQARWSVPSAVVVDRLKDVKALGDGVLVSITSAKVALNASGIYSDGSVYVSETDRTCGMKITGAGSISLGDNLMLTGTTDTDVATGERVLRVSSVSIGGNTPIGAVGMINRTASASGRLVTVWGKVTGMSAAYFTLDDGSGGPVRVQTDGLATPLSSVSSVGAYVSATGPAGLMAGGVTAVRPRSQSDIRVY